MNEVDAVFCVRVSADFCNHFDILELRGEEAPQFVEAFYSPVIMVALQ